VVHRTVFGALGWSNINWLLSGKERGDVAIIHRTVQWRTGLSGEPTVPATNGWPRDQRVTRGPCQRSVGHTELSGEQRTLSDAPTDPEDQRSDALDMEGDRTPNCYSDCPVVHRTVRCTTRQKGKIGLPSWPPMAPSCLGAIKRDP
jgi:hypothetical protein